MFPTSDGADLIHFRKHVSEPTEPVLYSIELPQKHAYFDGHFDGFPVFPGVAQLELVIKAIALEVNKNVRVCGIKKAKFLKFVPPGANLILSLKLSLGHEASYELRLDAECVSKGVLRYG